MTKQLHEQFEPFSPQHLRSYGNSGDVFAWAGDAVYETIANGIRRALEEDWNFASSCLKSFRLVATKSDQNIRPQRREFSSWSREHRKVTVA